MTPGEQARVLEHPALFAELCLGVDLWEAQRAIVEAVASHSRVAVKACHSSGKSYAAAVAVLWWIMRYSDGIALTTAATWTQVERILWREIRALALGARLSRPLRPLSTQISLSPSNFAIGLSTNEGVRFQGFHARHLLVVMDEAAGIRGDIWEAVDSLRAGGDAHVLAISNPVVPSGPFYDLFTRGRDLWQTFTINAFETPNLRGLAPDNVFDDASAVTASESRPYLITRAWVREKYLEWGVTSPFWEARVLGQFPTQAADAMYPLVWLERARAASTAADGAPTRLVAGVDVAGAGEDETAVYLRTEPGSAIVGMLATAMADPRGTVAEFLSPHVGKLAAVNVDADGIGYNFALHLQDLGFPVRMIRAGRAAANPERFANYKAEMYWGLRELLERGAISGLTDDTTIAQLSQVVWELTPGGQARIEGKKQARLRGLRSPDRAEALMLAFAQPSGAEAFLAYLRSGARDGVAPTVAPEAAEALPWAKEPRVTVAADSLQAEYDRIVADGGGAPAIRSCAACGRSIERGASYRSDGVSAWHVGCG